MEVQGLLVLVSKRQSGNEDVVDFCSFGFSAAFIGGRLC